MEWISVKDRLPEYSIEVIVCTYDGDVTTGWYWSKEHYQCDYDGFYDYEQVLFNTQITHWMPLPKPPKP